MKEDLYIENPKRRIVDDLKIRNKDNMKIIAGEYFGTNYSYEKTFKMIESYKKAFIAVDGLNNNSITISAPSTIASVNAFYGAMDANKVINLTGPGFLQAYTEKYTKNLNCETVFIFDGFLSDELINNLHKADIKNLIIMSISDYMNPVIKTIALQKGIISKSSFVDEYVKRHKSFPSNMEVLTIIDFSKIGEKSKEIYEFPYKEDQLAARFLTGATTSQIPKCVKISADGFTKMARIYDKLWFDFEPGDRQTVFIPLFYATGAIHGIHAGFFDGMTLIYKPKYDRFAFGKDMLDSKTKLTLVAPSHVATLDESNLKNNSLNHVKYIFVGGEAITTSQMKKFRKTATRLGIKYILNGYGMTETGSMSGISEKEYDDEGDVTVVPVPGVKYKIVDPNSGLELPNNKRGILYVKSPCSTLGYLENEKNKQLFAEDGWINTGDVAIRYDNGHYRIFGRQTDYFSNDGKSYAMFDIEEKVLEIDNVAEAEVIKFNINEDEFPAIVCVLKNNTTNDLLTTLKDIYSIQIPEIKYLIGVRFINNFDTNPVTSKRDYLSLSNYKTDYYSIDEYGNIFCNDIGKSKIEISTDKIKIHD
jgi:acyl-coenzyme A synthetase/AMP-(fatty) acid ligase